MVTLMLEAVAAEQKARACRLAVMVLEMAGNPKVTYFPGFLVALKQELQALAALLEAAAEPLPDFVTTVTILDEQLRKRLAD